MEWTRDDDEEEEQEGAYDVEKTARANENENPCEQFIVPSEAALLLTNQQPWEARVEWQGGDAPLKTIAERPISNQEMRKTKEQREEASAARALLPFALPSPATQGLPRSTERGTGDSDSDSNSDENKMLSQSQVRKIVVAVGKSKASGTSQAASGVSKAQLLRERPWWIVTGKR